MSRFAFRPPANTPRELLDPLPVAIEPVVVFDLLQVRLSIAFNGRIVVHRNLAVSAEDPGVIQPAVGLPIIVGGYNRAATTNTTKSCLDALSLPTCGSGSSESERTGGQASCASHLRTLVGKMESCL